MKRALLYSLCALCAGPAWAAADAPAPAQALQAAPTARLGLAGLWSLNLAADLARLGGDDLLSYYAQGALSAPPPSVFPGFSLALRRHLGDRFFVGLNLSSLPKGYNVDLNGSSDTWSFDGLWLGLSAGWVLLQAGPLALYAEGQAGWLSLINGSLDRSGAGATTGALDGSGLAEQLGLGLQWFILPSVALEAQGGIRSARLPLSLSTSSGRQRPPSEPEFYVDLGGAYGRLGISFFWGLRDPWGEQAAPPAPSAPPPAQD